MQRSIDRLLNSTIESKNEGGDPANRVIDENGKIKFDRRLFDLDTFKAILSKV